MKKNNHSILKRLVAKRLWFFFLAWVFLASCSGMSKKQAATATQPAMTTTLQTLRASKATQTASALLTHTPTLTPLIPSTTPTRTRTPTALIPSTTPTDTQTPTPLFPTVTAIVYSQIAISATVMTTQCLEITDGLGARTAPPGVLVFSNDGNKGAFLWNMQTGDKIDLPYKEGEYLTGFDVSPDKTRLVYWYSSDDGIKTIIAKADGQLIWSGAGDWYTWLDNDRLAALFPEPDKESFYWGLLNPFTGERAELHNDFPYFVLSPVYPQWYVAPVAIYDPTLTRAVFPGYTQWVPHGERGYPLILWDLETGQALARLITMDGYGGTPIWSPDGSQFIIATKLDPKDAAHYDPHDGFYSVSREGEARQLAYFPGMAIWDGYSLSPDGRQVAFWISDESKWWEIAHLAVLDTITGEVTNYCIADTAPDHGRSQIIWSPDSKWLLTTVPDPASKYPPDSGIQWNTILVNLVQGWAATIAENVDPVGWMINP